MLVVSFCLMLTSPVILLTPWIHPVLVFRSVLSQLLHWRKVVHAVGR